MSAFVRSAVCVPSKPGVTESFKRSSLCLFEHVLGVLRRGGKAHRFAVNFGNEAKRDPVMARALAIRPLRAVGAGKLDPVTVKMVDGAKVNVVGTHHVHMFANAAGLGHGQIPLCAPSFQRVWRGLVALGPLALLAACANQVESAVAHTADTPGFLLGLWHGFIFPVAWVLSLFLHNVAIYAVPNNGGWYNFGYFIGIVFLGVGARKGGKTVITLPIYRERL